MTDFSYQLYSSRNFDFDETLALLQSTGYKGVEAYDGLLSDFGDPIKFKDKLEAHNLEMKSCHMGVDFIKKDIPAIVSMAKTLGLKSVYAPYLDESLRPQNDEGWKDFGAMLNELAKPFNDAGIRFGWHNHDFEFTKTVSGAMPIELMLEAADEIDLELDVAWVVRANYDPSTFFSAYGSRISAAHVKDIAPAGENMDQDGWSDVGSGVVNWRQYMSELKAHNVDHFIMEHDNPKDHVSFATNSINAMKAL